MARATLKAIWNWAVIFAVSGWKTLQFIGNWLTADRNRTRNDAALNHVHAPEQQGDPTHQVEENDWYHSGLRCSNIDHAQKAIILEYAAAPHGFSLTELQKPLSWRLLEG